MKELLNVLEANGIDYTIENDRVIMHEARYKKGRKIDIATDVTRWSVSELFLQLGY